MAQIVKNAKDGVDSMIEVGNAVQVILTSRPPTSITQEAKHELELIGKRLKKVRDTLARESQVPTSARSQRASTRFGQ